jgi:hypothetical protein
MQDLRMWSHASRRPGRRKNAGLEDVESREPSSNACDAHTC